MYIYIYIYIDRYVLLLGRSAGVIYYPGQIRQPRALAHFVNRAAHDDE